MGFSKITLDGQTAIPSTPISWAGGPARLYLQRFPSAYRLPEADLELLAPSERARLTRAARPEKTHRALRARLQLRLMLSEVLDLAPQEIELSTDPEGRPGLHLRYGISRDSLDFSISYAPQGFVVGVAHGHRVGVDIQRFDHRQKESFGRLFGGGTARRSITALKIQEIWTRMEAYGKMQGEGLGHGMHRLYSVAVDPSKASIPCRFYDFRLGVGASVAVCLSGASSAPICLEG